MRFEWEVRDGLFVARPKGRFVTGCEAVLQSAEAQLQQNAVDKAIVDLSEVPYLDSTGLAFVVELHKLLKSRGGQLALASPNERVNEVLTLTRLGEIVPVYDNLENAEAGLRGEVLC
jgi:anti-sigma B factor antagonist